MNRRNMQRHRKISFVAFLAIGCVLGTPAWAQAPQPTGVIIENVRIFNGTSDRLSAPSNVLVIGNVIKTISTTPIAAPEGTTVTRIAGGGANTDARADR
jgi:hypothetical protein